MNPNPLHTSGPAAVVVVGRTSVGDLCHIPVSVEGVTCVALVDTGSTVTLVRPDILPAHAVLEPTTVQLRTVTGELSPMKGKGTLTFVVGGKTVQHLVWAADVQDPCILGLDFLRSTGCQLDLAAATLCFPGEQPVSMAPPPLRCSHTTPYTPTPHTIAAESPIHHAGMVKMPTTPRPSSAPHSQPTIDQRHVLPVISQTTPTKLRATDPTPLPCPALPTPIASVAPAQQTTQTHKNQGPTLLPAHPSQTEEGKVVSAVRDIWQRNCTVLDSKQGEELWQLLLQFKDIFALEDSDVGRTHLVQHDINTGNSPPIKLRPRRLPLARQEAADKVLWEMQQAGIVEPSDSPWASPVVMVPKKNGQWRFCVDYRRLNAVTRKDSYPLPRVDETLDRVAGSTWFSSLDLRSGYWQVPLSPSAKPKTAFCTSHGHWQFNVLPFGLCNSPATFERLMDKVLSGVPRHECVVYLDDILAHGPTFQAALYSLQHVLERVAAAGLKLHPEKCRFMQREVEFLGHRLGGEGIGTMNDKVQAVRDWPTPTNPQQLKSFLGLASYYRRFVRGFSCVAAPLFRLLRKEQEFEWTRECQTAFTSLQRALGEAPVLAPADPSLPFILDCDASGQGVGGVLSQMCPEGERVVAYYSRTFNKHERRYCVTRRELLAVLMSIRHFKYYLCGLSFTVRTDHSALQWLMSFKEPEGQVARWIEELQAYDFRVVHRAGANHANADALSRRPCTEDGCRHCERKERWDRELQTQEEDAAISNQTDVVVCCELVQCSPAHWREKQEADMDIQPVLRWIEMQRRPPWQEVAPLSTTTKGLWAKFEALRLVDGVLHRAWKDPAAGELKWQLVVPRTERLMVLQAMHGATGSGHFGVTKTLRRLRHSFYWGQSRRDVEDFCRRCDSCTAKKGPSEKSHAPLQQFPVGAPMERVGVDIVGPLPLTDSGNRYVLAAMDYFTKWPEAYALPDQGAETVANALLEGMICRFGTPQCIHSDQGRNFESQVFTALCHRLGITKTRTTPLHPQSDGLVERFNRTLIEQLAIVTAKHQRDWDKHLPLVLMACRSAVQESTACTPALLMLGRELSTPAAMAFGLPPDTPAVPPGPEYTRRLQERLETAHAFARAQLQNAGVRQRRNYDLHHKGRHLEVGEMVWTYSPQRKKGRCPKLDSDWLGPCRVLERLGEVVYRVQLPPRGRRVAVHRDRLAPYKGGITPPLSPRHSQTPPDSPNLGPTSLPQTPATHDHTDTHSNIQIHTHRHPLSLAPSPSEAERGPSLATPPRSTRPHRQKRPPVHLRDFV